MGETGGDEVKDSDMVVERSRCIARETPESVYSWDRDRVGKTEIVNDRVRVD